MAALAILAAVLGLLSMVDGNDAGKVMVDGPVIGAGGSRIQYRVGPAQRCNVLRYMKGLANYIAWEDTQDSAWLVLFKDYRCDVELYKSKSAAGTLSDSETGFQVNSFMIWESGIYATRGIVEADMIREGFVWDEIESNSSSSSSGSMAGLSSVGD